MVTAIKSKRVKIDIMIRFNSVEIENSTFINTAYFFAKRIPKKSHQLLIKLPPLVGQLVAHGLVVVFFRAGDEVVPLVFLVIVLQERHIHPPFACDLVAKEDNIILILTNLHDVTLEIVAPKGRDVILTAREALDEIPNHLGDEVGRARVDVVMRIVFKETDG